MAVKEGEARERWKKSVVAYLQANANASGLFCEKRGSGNYSPLTCRGEIPTENGPWSFFRGGRMSTYWQQISTGMTGYTKIVIINSLLIFIYNTAIWQFHG
jgi:hypothetical protein